LPEERIFTVPGGQKIAVTLDKKPMEMTFPNDMKLVSPTVLVRQEEQLNNALLGKVKADKSKVATIGLLGSILAILGAVIGLFRKKWWPNIKFGGEIK
jgi:hypothetical protein